MSLNTILDSDSSIDIDNKNSIQKVSLKEICNIYNMYPKMESFLNKYESDDIKQKLNSLKITFDTEEKTDPEYDLLVLLKLYKDMRKMDKERRRYIRKAQTYEQHKSLYNNNQVLANDINNLLNSENKDSKVMTQYIQRVFSEHKMINELIIYKLLYHTPLTKVKVSKNNYMETVGKICLTLNSVSSLLVSYLEDHTWTIHYKSTRNFIVPKNKVIITNTVSVKDMKNTFFKTYMAMITNYLTRCYDGSIKHIIEEDSKYDFAWVFITVRYENSN